MKTPSTFEYVAGAGQRAMIQSHIMRIWLLVLSLVLMKAITNAEVIDSGAIGFSVTNKTAVQADPGKAMDAIIRVGDWWSSDHTFFGSSKKMFLEPKAGGCFCEVDDQRQVSHGTVVFYEPGKLLRISTALGPLQEHGVTGALTFLVAPGEKGSAIEMTYRAGGYFPGGLDKIAPVVDSVQSMILKRLQRYIDTGSPEETK